MTATLLNTERHWSCPNCTVQHVTGAVASPLGGGVAPFHACRGLRGLKAPLVPDGTRCKVVAHEREDYLNGDIQRRDGEGRPTMSVVTTRDDGQDVAVFAPVAQVGVASPRTQTSKAGRSVAVGARGARGGS